MRIETEDELDELLSRPTCETWKVISELEGDLLILGAGGKIGPTLCRLAKRACEEAGVDKKVTAVSRFSDFEMIEALERANVETLRCDLLEDLHCLPEVSNVIYMVGRKFGTEGDGGLTWAVNTYLPAIVAQKFKDSCFLHRSNLSLCLVEFRRRNGGHCT